MSDVPPNVPAVSRMVALTTAAVLFAALAWLGSRVFVGLDFTDEMQYYGEIASLTRTGRFFQDDLFIQQLGYFLLLPFFKVHALVFPDQSYLVLFGRLLLLAGYLLVGAEFWRSAARAGFSKPVRGAGLAVFFAWVPFQIFAFGYNSFSYLLIVTLVSVWMARRHRDGVIRDLPLCALIVAIGVVYPPAGLALAGIAAIDAGRRGGLRAVVRNVALTAGCGVALGGAVVVWHGAGFFADLAVALKFSHAFKVGETILQASHLGTWAALVGACGFFIWRRHRPPPAAPSRGLSVLVLLAGLTVLTLMSLRGTTGYLATAVFVMLVFWLRTFGRPNDGPPVTELAVTGLVLGSAFAFTSANGLHNFGVGAMGVVPFLVLGLAHEFENAAPNRPAAWAVAPPAIALLLLVNGVVHPYREAPAWTRFERAMGVPAFAGLWTSPVKVRAIQTFQRFFDHASLRGHRVLIVGPHPWIYFAARATPATSMYFFHFAGPPLAYEIVAARLFQGGEPDMVLVTNATPTVVYDRVMAWARPGTIAQTFALPADFIRDYRRQIDFDFSPEVYLLSRPPRQP